MESSLEEPKTKRKVPSDLAAKRANLMWVEMVRKVLACHLLQDDPLRESVSVNWQHIELIILPKGKLRIRCNVPVGQVVAGRQDRAVMTLITMASMPGELSAISRADVDIDGTDGKHTIMHYRQGVTDAEFKAKLDALEMLEEASKTARLSA